MRRAGAKSSVNDLGTGLGVVSSRAATILRSIETRPLTGRFVSVTPNGLPVPLCFIGSARRVASGREQHGESGTLGPVAYWRVVYPPLLFFFLWGSAAGAEVDLSYGRVKPPSRAGGPRGGGRPFLFFVFFWLFVLVC